ncbi:hypothetical protein DV736_g3372, partial [Chaetothyriales sp. CBS 134916]
MAGKTIFITGGSGVIGAHVVAGGIQLFEVDLSGDKGWDYAFKDAAFMSRHRIPLARQKNDDELINPTREEALRATRGQSLSGMWVAAIGYGHEKRTAQNPFTEKDWAVIKDPKGPVGACEKSKTLAKQAA